MTGESTAVAEIERIQRSALAAARVDDDPDALAFAGALEPARRAAVDVERTLLGSLTAVLLADRLANRDGGTDRFGPAAAHAGANPLPAGIDASPLVLGAALLVARTDTRTGDAATLAGVSITAVERALERDDALE